MQTFGFLAMSLSCWPVHFRLYSGGTRFEHLSVSWVPLRRFEVYSVSADECWDSTFKYATNVSFQILSYSPFMIIFNSQSNVDYNLYNCRIFAFIVLRSSAYFTIRVAFVCSSNCVISIPGKAHYTEIDTWHKIGLRSLEPFLDIANA
jgi:hypothetical protein